MAQLPGAEEPLRPGMDGKRKAMLYYKALLQISQNKFLWTQHDPIDLWRLTSCTFFLSLSLSRSVARNEYLIPAVWHDFFSPITCHTSSYIYLKMLFFCVWISLSFLIDPSESAAGRQRSTERPGHQWKPKISRRGLGVVEWQPGDHWLELFLLGKSTISMGYHGI